jgi:hypothetical protein
MRKPGHYRLGPIKALSKVSSTVKSGGDAIACRHHAGDGDAARFEAVDMPRQRLGQKIDGQQ